MNINLKTRTSTGLRAAMLTSTVCVSILAFAPDVLAYGNVNNTGAAFEAPSSDSLFTPGRDITNGKSNADTLTVLTEDQENTLRDMLLQARLDLETGHIYSATKLLNNAMPEYKSNAEFLGFDANAENYGGNWPYATELLNQAHSIAPDDQDISALLFDVRREHAPNIEADFDWIKYGHSLEDISSVSGFVNAGNHLIIGGDIKDDYVMGRGVHLDNGVIGDKNGNKEQGEVYAQYSIQNGQQFKGAVFGNNEKAGGGGYYTFLNPLGETTLTGEYHRPYWELPEAVLDDTTRDRIALKDIIKPTSRLTLEGEAGYNWYNVDTASDALQSVTADLNVLYRIVDEVKYQKPFVDLGYNLDAEYVRSHKLGLDTDGGDTSILPLYTREIHTPFVEVGYDFSPSTYGDIEGGYQWDRHGGNGPMAAAKITHEITQAFDVQLRAEYGVDSTNSENSITTVGGYVRWRF